MGIDKGDVRCSHTSFRPLPSVLSSLVGTSSIMIYPKASKVRYTPHAFRFHYLGNLGYYQETGACSYSDRLVCNSLYQPSVKRSSWPRRSSTQSALFTSFSADPDSQPAKCILYYCKLSRYRSKRAFFHVLWTSSRRCHACAKVRIRFACDPSCEG